MSSIQNIDSVDVSTMSTIDDISKHVGNSYDYIHVVLTGLQPFSKALRSFRHAIIFKHIVTPSIGLRNALSTKICYSVVNSWENRLVRCFSSKFVANSYFMDSDLIVPPSIDISTFTNTGSISEEKVLSLLDLSPAKFGLENLRNRADGLMLYSGPLTQDRFPYRKVLNALKQTRSQLLIIGRPSNNGADVGMAKEIISYAKNINLENRVSIALKLLTEDEKITFLNFADVIIQPFEKSTHSYVAVDPPIFLLEAMSCGKPVITSKAYSFQSFIKNGYNGYAIDWDDSYEVDEAMKGCQNTAGLGMNARQTVEQGFSNDYVSERIQKIYNDYN